MSNKEAWEMAKEREEWLASLAPAPDLEFTVPLTGNKPVEGPTSLQIDFPGPQEMTEFIEELYESRVLPRDTGLFMQDALDNKHGKQVFVVKREEDRPDYFRLRSKEVVEEKI